MKIHPSALKHGIAPEDATQSKPGQPACGPCCGLLEIVATYGDEQFKVG